MSKYTFLLKGGSRSRSLAEACFSGLSKCGEIMTTQRRWDGRSYDEVIFGYSWISCNGAFLAHKHNGKKFVYLDLGYWNRRPPGMRWTGYHKFSINDFHPTEYFRLNNPDDRFRKTGCRLKPWKTDRRSIVVVGMSVKAAQVAGLGFEQWEKETVQELRKHTDRPIIYRAKPNSLEAKPIAGCKWSQTEPMEHVLRDAHAVVTHHSNMAIDSLAFGVPVYCQTGLASTMSMESISDIENPYYPDGRVKLLFEVAYCQWNVDEIKKGKPFRYYRDKGLLP